MTPDYDVLTVKARDQVGTELQATLIDLIDLALQAKQAHWNVVGPRFSAVHQHLDDLTDAYREWSDTVAERMTAVGVSPSGQANAVAEGARLDVLPEGVIEDTQVLTLFADRIATLACETRGRVERLGSVDVVSQGILIVIVEGMEKQLWMLRAQAT